MVGHSFQNYGRVYVSFSAACTCLHTLPMGFGPIYGSIWIAYIRIFKGPHICVNSGAGMCKINAQIYASYRDHIYVCWNTRVCGSHKLCCICWHGVCLLGEWLLAYDGGENCFNLEIVNMMAEVRCLVLVYLLCNVCCSSSPVT